MRTSLLLFCLYMGIQLDAQKRINYFSDLTTVDWSGNECHYALVYKTDSNVRMEFYACGKKKVKTESFEKGFRPLSDDRELFRQGEQLNYHSNGTVSKRMYIRKAVPRNGQETSYDSLGKLICTGSLLNGERQQGGFMDRFENGSARIENYEQGRLKSIVMLDDAGDTSLMETFRPSTERPESTYRYKDGKVCEKKLYSRVGNGLDSVIEILDPATNSFRQTYHRDSVKNNGEIFLSADRMASFKGGNDQLHTYIVNNTKYPQQAREMGIEGKIIVEFVVNTDGSLNAVKALGSNNNPMLEAEALRVIKSTSGMWTPASHNGAPVRMRMQIPIVFSLK